MKTISSAVSKIILKIFVGAALTSTIMIATYKSLNALEFYFIQFEQGPLWELVCYVPIILICYWILYINTQSIFSDSKMNSKSAADQPESLVHNLISRFALGFLEGYETQSRTQQSSAPEQPHPVSQTRPISRSTAEF